MLKLFFFFNCSDSLNLDNIEDFIEKELRKTTQLVESCTLNGKMSFQVFFK